jgi:AAA+ ATPase superfamily predicted ATPase
MTTFVGRKRELKAFSQEFDKDRPSLVIVYGRRRIGKSALLIEATRGRETLYFQSTIAPASSNLESLKNVIAETLGSPELVQGLGTWESVFHHLAGVAQTRPGLVLIIDEFPYLVNDDKSLPSVLQRFWDSGAANAGNLKIVLCGSAISQMEELLAERNPLYGRKTMSMDVKPLPLRDAALFFPDYSAEEAIKTYAVFGGVPHYLAMCDPNKSLRDNVVSLLLTRTGALVDEPEFLLRSEFNSPTFYAGIIAAIADGCQTGGTIADRLKVETSALGIYVDKLLRIDLISSRKSLHAEDRARNRRLRLTDRLLAFWYHFVPRNLTAIEAGFGAELFDKVIERGFPDFMGDVFEEVCQQYARQHLVEMTGVPAAEVGSLWGYADFDIDVAGTMLDGTPFFGEAKWRAKQIDLGMVATLKERSDRSGYRQDIAGKQYLLFSRAGFKPEVENLAKTDASVHLVSLETLVHAPQPEPTVALTP